MHELEYYYYSTFELQRKSGLPVSSEKYCIFLFFGGQFVRNITTFEVNLG